MGNPLSRFFSSLSRGCVSWTLIVLVFWPFLASPAQAMPVAVVEDLPKKVETVTDSIWTSITRAAMVGLFNAFQTFLGQLAYDAADYIVTGSSGQTATYYKKSFGSYLLGVASDSAGEFIGSISSEEFFRTAGINLCKPSARQLLRFQLALGNFFPGMQGRFQRPRPKCNFKDIIKNYDTLYQSLSNGDVLKNIQFSVNTNSSDLGVTFNLLNQAQQKIALDVSNKKEERKEGGGFKSITNFLSGNIKTPAQVVNEAAKDSLVRLPKEGLLTTIGATLSSGMEQGFIQLATYTASIFVNTLVSKLLKKVFEGGLDDSVAQLQLSADQVTQTRPTDTRNLTVSLKTPNLQKVENFDVVTELATCPNETRGTWNCTIDQGFRSALVRNDQGGITVRTALAGGLLHGDWQLIPARDLRRNQERDCYAKAYCAGNLGKLRLLRMLPIGFELAANSAENIRRCGPQGAGCVTLQEVVNGFTACSGAEATPWCHLIDPDWILAALPQQCVLKGYGEQLISSTLGQRREECQDVQTCLRRNDQGECVGGYGYCAAEKTVYRFGADECLPRQASCRSYQTRGGGDVSYLRNTTDQATCDADNVGCLWYATTRDPERGAEAWIGTTSTGPRVYLNAKVETCSASAEGCTKVREAVVGRSSLNLVINPSFERKTDATPPTLIGWTLFPPPPAGVAPWAPTVLTGDAHVTGDSAIDLNTSPTARTLYFQAVAMNPAHSYALSFSARLKTTGRPARVNALISESSSAVAPVPVFDRRTFKSAGCAVVAGARVAGISVPATGETLSTNWERFECTFVTTSSTRGAILTIFGDPVVADSNALVDDVQLEEGEYATDFVDGVSESLVERHLKIAPDEFACTGEDTDSPTCDRFAKVCRQIEAGCNGYTDAVTGGREIPAILSTNDLCPSTCVGYAEYRKSPSAFDLTKDPDDRFSDPVDASSSYFIASTAASCRREEVGCEAFTNVEGTSGEQQAYLTYVRACRKPGPASQTFFTWEGSDTSGYQLRTWSLVHDTATPPAPLILTKREPGSLSVKEPSTCNEPTWRTALDPDCRQFYDADGRVFYRYYSQTVLSTPGCTDFRVTRSSRPDCEKTDGAFDASTNECLYHVYLPLSQLCAASAVGCREYRGVTAGANLSIINESFRGATNTRGFVGVPPSALRLSDETLLVGDQSLRLDVPARTGSSVSIPFVSPADDHQYSVTFWAKPALATSTVQLTVRDAADATRPPTIVGSVLLTTDWQRYTVGPFLGYPGASTSTLVWTASGSPSPYVVFLDEVSLVRIQDRTYVRRETWNTPVICDQNAYGVPQSQAMLGCRAYRSRDNQSVNVKDFTRLCREAAIGCKGFVDTRNSTDVGEQMFERGDTPPIPGFGSATTKRLADRMRYLIDEPNARCTSDQDSCRALGKPGFSADRVEITGFTTVYIKDDITRYDRLLCRPSELFCEQFTYNGSNEYFRNPDNHVCEYREQVADVVGVAGGTYGGWFEVGSNPPRACYPMLLESGRNFGIARRADPGYRGWVGLCEPEADACTELRDPIDGSDSAHPSGKPYFFIHNEHLNTSSCPNGVDRANGCILLRDTESEDIRFNARATYATQQALTPPRPIQPIDCVRNPADPQCRAQAGHCVGTIRYCPLTDRSCASTPSTPGSLSPTGALLGNLWQMSFADVLWYNNPELLRLLNCRTDRDCTDTTPQLAPDGRSYYTRAGTCKVENDANLIVKVNLDRDCAQWLGCSSSEVVFDPATNRPRSLCTNLALCDKGKQEAGDQYCEGYVNRSTSSTEPMLTQGIALTQPRYVGRAIGLGEKEYSGYAIPNAFLPIDLVNGRVAIDGTDGDTRATGKFARDYRLVTAVSMPPTHDDLSDHREFCAPSFACVLHNQPPLDNQARVLDRRTRLGAAYPSLHLCQHIQTNLIGYYLPEKMSATSTSFCYLATSFDPATISDPDVRRSPYDFNSLALGFTETDANNDGFVRQAFPAAECRANPEADSPFAANYVTAWDTTKNPPKPTQRAPGFTRVNVCEYGQDCSCTYKRADYSQAAISKFFNANAQTVPSGVCVGGPRDGEACIPGAVSNAGGDASGANVSAPVVSGTGSAATASIPERKRAAEASNVSQTCGDEQLGGHCVILSRVETVRGVFGQCLERDVTRTVTIGNTQEQPCLTWNPGPILFGEHDTYHYSPSAGYQPPPGSGQYYCLSATRKPTTMRFDPSDFIGQEPPIPLSIGAMSVVAGVGAAATIGFTPAAMLGLFSRSSPSTPTAIFSGSMKKISYDDDYVSRETENAGGTASILGHSGKEGQSARDCEDADDEQDIDNQARDYQGLRLVSTGADLAHSYTEAFFAINQKKFVADLFNEPNPSASLVASGMMDSNIGYIKIQPFLNANGIGRLGCGYQNDWVDGGPSVDYDDKDSLRSGDAAWRQKFFASYSPLLTRGSEKYLTKGTNGFVTRPCVKTNSTELSKTCGFKYWELGYRSEGQLDLFNGAFSGPDRIGYDEGFDELRTRPGQASTKCASEKPYFAIRAVFQAEAPAGTTVRPSGPWRFVGFWVASCAGRTNDVRYMYMNVDVVSADICKELAEVRSKDSLQDAAFTDRVWKEAAYTAPRIGTQYSSKFAPFASAVTSRPITEAGIEPLFQAGGDVVGFSPLNPPTFLAPGSDSYHRPEQLPKDKWAFLSNLFARVYRVYRYYEEEVKLGDKACLDGPFKGEACTPDVAGAASGSSKQCSIQGVCDTNLLESSAIDSYKMCDAMSGLNAGVSCADDPDVCHTGGVYFDAQGVSRQQLHACVLNTSMWAQNPDGTYDALATRAAPEHYSASEASQQYLRDNNLYPPFMCQGGMRIGGDCSGLATASRECPEEILGKCVVPHPAPRRPDHFEVLFGVPVVNVPNSVTSTKCATPRYIRGSDTPSRVAGAPDIPGTRHVVRDDVEADRYNPVSNPSGYNPLDHPEKVYVDPTTHLVYDVVTNNEYTSCQADYDCSFTPYNYYMKRLDSYPPLFSMRSRRYQWRRGTTYVNYGSVLGSEGGGCDTNTSTNECMRETAVDIAGCQGGELTGPGGIWTGGPRRVAMLLPSRVVSSGGVSSNELSHIVGDVDDRCSIQAWRQGFAGLRISGGVGVMGDPHFDQTNACGQRAGASGKYHDGGYLDALVSDMGISGQPHDGNGVGEISPHILSELTRDPGVNHTALRTPSDRDFFDQIVNLGPACLQTAQWINIPFATCVSPKDLSRSKSYGRCRGGAKAGSLCRVGSVAGDLLSCEYALGESLVPAGAPPLHYTRLDNDPTTHAVTRSTPPLNMSTLGEYETAVNRCGLVSIDLGGGASHSYRPVAACAKDGVEGTQTTVSTDLDNDNNICTHTAGYHPRVDLCPDPSDEFCGLIAYKRGDVPSLTPGTSPFPLATDVTVGHYTPDYLMNSVDRGPFLARFSRNSLSYINFYRPYPPQVAAVDSGQCRQPGQCAVTRTQTFSFNGQTEGPLPISGGQHKSTIQFYAWASHNQMPIRRMMIDWGDGFVQSLPDAKIKNHKPFCGGTKECYIVTGPTRGHTGLTCNTDNDCPAGYGRCENMGTCVKQADKTCAQDSDCTGGTSGVVGDRCNIRQFFGNSPDACEQNYFEFSHVYVCNGQRSVMQPTCSTAYASGSDSSIYHCARNPEVPCGTPGLDAACGPNEYCLADLAPKGGCWDETTHACHFTPRVLVEDNWGWCTGECRQNRHAVPGVGGAPATVEVSDDTNGDATVGSEMVSVAHPFGGCYSGMPVNGTPNKNEVRLNTNQRLPLTDNECNAENPGDSDARFLMRPWIVYPGSLQLRSR